MIKKLIVEPEQQQARAQDPDMMYIEQVKAGNEDAFKHLVARHKEKVRNLIFFTMNATDHVDDIAQEVFIKVYRKLDKFRYDSRFTTWLYRVTVNHCKDELRKKRFWNFFSVFENGHENKVSENNTVKFDTKDLVHQAIAQLPEKLKIPLVLKDIDGFSYKEIADITDTEIGTVKSRISRARDTLKEILLPVRGDLDL